MGKKGKGSWRLPVIVAVGAVAYCCAMVKFSTDPAHQRRRAILQRLYDGTSPRTLLEGGYTREELLDAGVPRSSLSPSHSGYADNCDGSSASQLEGRDSEQCEHHDSPHRGLLIWLYSSLGAVTETVQAAFESIVGNFYGPGTSASLKDAKSTSIGDSNPRTFTSLVFSAKAGSTKAAHSTSVRLAPALLRGSSNVETHTDSVASDKSRSRTPGEALQVHVAALSAAVARGYSEESSTYRYPLEVARFLHEDGSRLSIMAEDCFGMDSNGAGVVTTEVYVQRSLARARAAADVSKAYFKVKLSTAARNIATTVMESYVNTHIGPSPVILACFYLVSRGMAYTIQLQTHTGAYEERLSDLLYTAQSARLHENNRKSKDGRVIFRMQTEGVDGSYLLEVPVGLVVRAETKSGSCRSALTLTPSNGDPSSFLWSATVEMRPVASEATASLVAAKTLLRDAHVWSTLTLHNAEEATSSFSALLDKVSARRVSADDAAAPANAYVSSFLTLPLPPPEQFCSMVFEHWHDSFVTVFISTTAPHDVDTFEVELRCMNGLHKREPDSLFAYLATLFLTPSEPMRAMNGAGQETFAIEGLAAALPETSLCVYGVHVGEGSWLVVRWLYADSAVFPRELEQYRRALIENVRVG